MRFLLGFLLLLTGCVAVPTTSSPLAQTLVYSCDGGYVVTARELDGSLQLSLPAKVYQLSISDPSQGQKYVGQGVSFRKKGEDAELILEGQLPRACRRDRAAAIWEDARFRGVDFRAAGNEPGWFVELDRKKLLYVGHYGQQQLIFPAVAAQSDDARAETSYESVSAEHRISLLLQTGDCRDSMSGRLFGTRVTLVLDGQKLYGCGQSLH